MTESTYTDKLRSYFEKYPRGGSKKSIARDLGWTTIRVGTIIRHLMDQGFPIESGVHGFGGGRAHKYWLAT